MAIPAPIGNVRPVITRRIQAQEEREEAVQRAAYLQGQYDDYNASLDEYNLAVERYREAEGNYNAAIEALNAAEQSGQSSEIQAAGVKVAGTAGAVNDALDNLQQKEAAHNKSLLSLVDSGIITSDIAGQYEIKNAYNKLDEEKLSGAVNNAVIRADTISYNRSIVDSYNASIDKVNESYARLESLSNQYNAATTQEERDSISAQYNAEIEAANSNIDAYNNALKTVQGYGLVDKSKSEITHLEPAVVTTPVADGSQNTPKTPLGLVSKIAADISGSLQEHVSNAKLKDSGLGFGGFIATNILALETAKTLHNVSNIADTAEKYAIKAGDSILGVIQPVQEALYNAGQWMNPSDENVIKVREEKIAVIDNILGGTENPVANFFGDVAKSAVSEKKTVAEEKYQTVNRINAIADVVGNAGDMLPTPEGRFLADKLESGIRMDADYTQYGFFGEDGNIHSPGLLSATATGLVGGAIGAVVAGAGGLGISSLPSAAKSLASDIFGIGGTGTGAGLTLEGMSTSEYMASRGLSGAGRGAGGMASISITKSSDSISAANIAGGNLLSNELSGINKLTNVEFNASEIAPGRNSNKEKKSTGLGSENSIFNNMLDEYPSRNREDNKNRLNNRNGYNIDLNSDYFNEEVNINPDTTRRGYGTIGDSIFGNTFGDTFGNSNRNDYRTSEDYIFEFEYPTRPGTARGRGLNWDDGILSGSKHKKRTSPKNDLFREILRI